MVRADIDGKGRGLAVTAAVSLSVASRTEVVAGAIVGGHLGTYLGAVHDLLGGRWRPQLLVGIPVFFVDGVHPGVHAAAGLAWGATPALGAFVQVGVQHYPTAPAEYDATLWVPSVGVRARF